MAIVQNQEGPRKDGGSSRKSASDETKCLMLTQAGSEHHKRSGSTVLATGIQEGDIQSLVGAVIVSKGMG